MFRGFVAGIGEVGLRRFYVQDLDNQPVNGAASSNRYPMLIRLYCSRPFRGTARMALSTDDIPGRGGTGVLLAVAVMDRS